MMVLAPKDEDELRHMLATAIAHDGPAAVRYPRGAGAGVALDGPATPLPIGRAEILRKGDDLAILAVGSMALPALAAAEMLAGQGVRATVVNARFVKPLDEVLLRDLGTRFDAILTVEENAVAGGFGSAVAEALDRLELGHVAVHRLGIPDLFVDHGPQSKMRDALNLSADGIVREVHARFGALFAHAATA